jgi:hypothetical protein
VKLTNEELAALIESHRADALGVEDGELTNERAVALDRYHGRPYGNEVEGRSAVVSKDLSEAVDWAMPAIMRIFTNGKTVATLDPVGPEDEAQAELETEYVNQVLMKDNPGWIVLHDAIKDALLLKNGYVKHFWDETEKVETVEYQGLAIEEVQRLMQDLAADRCEVKILGQDEKIIQTPQGPMPVYDLELVIKRKEGKVVIEAVPAEEVRVSRKCRGSLQDSPFVEHVTTKTRSDLIEMGMKRDFVESLPAYTESNYGNSQSLSRDSVSDESTSYTGTSVNDRSMDEIEYAEAYVRVDWDGDGVAELRRVVTVGKQIPDGKEWNTAIPECALTTFVAKRVPHRHVGESLYDDLGDLQEIKTVLMRQMLDNIYLVNNSEKAVNERVNLNDFMTSLPGGIKRIEGIEPVAGAFMPIVTPSIVGDILPVIGFIDDVKESRTGITKASAGLDPDTLSNVTKGAFMENMNRASQKIEMITRMICETGVRELVLRVHSLLTRYQDKQRIVRMAGKYVPINPQGWRERTDVTVNVGLGTGNEEDKQRKLMLVAQMQRDMLAPVGMVEAKQAHQLFVDVAKSMGFDTPDKYAMSPDSPEFQQKMAQPQPDPALQLEQAKQQGQMQLAQVKAQSDVMIEREKAQAQMQVDITRQQAEAEQKQMQIQQEAMLEQFKAQLEAQQERARLDLEQWKTQLDNQTRIQIEHIKRGEMIAPDALGEMLNNQSAVNSQLAQSIAEMLQAAVAQIRAPKRIIRDANGRAAGIE